jgi:hypothetical protein
MSNFVRHKNIRCYIFYNYYLQNLFSQIFFWLVLLFTHRFLHVNTTVDWNKLWLLTCRGLDIAHSPRSWARPSRIHHFDCVLFIGYFRPGARRLHPLYATRFAFTSAPPRLIKKLSVYLSELVIIYFHRTRHSGAAPNNFIQRKEVTK